jgi:hypothetical protein
MDTGLDECSANRRLPLDDLLKIPQEESQSYNSYVPSIHINHTARLHISSNKKSAPTTISKNTSRSSCSVSSRLSPVPANNAYSISSPNAPATTVYPPSLPSSQSNATSSRAVHRYFHNFTTDHSLISSSNLPATKPYPLSLSSSQSRAALSREISFAGTSTNPSPLQDLQASKVPSFLQKVSLSRLFDTGWYEDGGITYPVDPLPAQEPQVFRLFMVRPVTLSILTVRERGGGLMPGRVRGVLVLSFVDFATIGCEVAIVGFIWSGSWRLLLVVQVGVKLHCGELYQKRRKRWAVCLYIRAVFRQRATWMPLIKTGDRSPCGGRPSTFFALRLDDDRAGFHPSGLVIRC